MDTEFSERVRQAEFAASEAERMNVLPVPCFQKPQRAIYEAPEGWRNWTEYTQRGEDYHATIR